MGNDWIRHSRRVKGTSLVVSLIIACAVAYSAAPAFGTNQNYECGSCTSVNGANNYIRNVFGQNKSGGGNCTNMWKDNGGGNYNIVERECVEGKEQGFDCPGLEIFGHGQTANTSAGFLWGNENNFKECI
jgi:hypothetical protein